ncbi:MAG TPA: hypothetical protein VKZ92_01240 [Pseudohongiella sp.]|nr:hypothetical protein [Pseudohongiella sp.]
MAILICGLLPLFNMLSPALLGLVLLRHGYRETMLVTAWAILPLVGWAIAGDVSPLLLAAGVLALATVLRRTVSWQYTLLAAVLVGGLTEMVLRLWPQLVSLQLQQLEAFMAAGGFDTQPELTLEALQDAVMRLFGMMSMFMSIILLMLARWWQALLYNPGGFQQEFHQLKLQPSIALLLLGLLLLASFGSTVLSGWILYLWVPLFFAGLALVHGLIGLKKLSRLWLVAFYVLLLSPMMTQLLAVAAVIDSWYDFRSRIKAA